MVGDFQDMEMEIELVAEGGLINSWHIFYQGFIYTNYGIR